MPIWCHRTNIVTKYHKDWVVFVCQKADIGEVDRQTDTVRQTALQKVLCCFGCYRYQYTLELTININIIVNENCHVCSGVNSTQYNIIKHIVFYWEGR